MTHVGVLGIEEFSRFVIAQRGGISVYESSGNNSTLLFLKDRLKIGHHCFHFLLIQLYDGVLLVLGGGNGFHVQGCYPVDLAACGEIVLTESFVQLRTLQYAVHQVYFHISTIVEEDDVPTAITTVDAKQRIAVESATEGKGTVIYVSGVNVLTRKHVNEIHGLNLSGGSAVDGKLELRRTALTGAAEKKDGGGHPKNHFVHNYFLLIKISEFNFV